ncbi:MAG: molybdopterin-binding protein [Eubacteriaceae bacterium]|jgi:hypothetical protein
MDKIKTEDAVGMILCQDMTQIIPGEYKGPRFRKGHRVTKEDIPVLLSMGKEYLYIWKNDPDLIHENDFARAMYEGTAGPNMHATEVKEGKTEAVADCDGLFKIDSTRLDRINSLGDMMIAARHGNFPVKKGDKLAGMRLIPLAAPVSKLGEFQDTVQGEPVFKILPFKPKKTAVFGTGNEVYKGLIEDRFTPVVEAKAREYGAVILSTELLPDDPGLLAEKIQGAVENGAELILCTGGMSVDPDDRTPAAIRDSGARIVTYGAPVLPGAMFLLGYLEGPKGTVPVCGLPGCVMYSKRTVFDLVLPRLMADDPVTKEELDGLGEGGLCLNCDTCTYPNCGFGK